MSESKATPFKPFDNPNVYVKFLTPSGTTVWEGKEFVYNLPQRGEKYSAPTWVDDPTPPDGRDCGPGRLHVMNEFNSIRAPKNWTPWFAVDAGPHPDLNLITGKVGASEEKSAFHGVRLRRISIRLYHWMIRRGWMAAAYLRGAYLRDANLRDANLRDANLIRADLRDANLRGADLRGANLSGAGLRGADLRGAYLSGADLRGADLRGANLSGADLSGAYLSGAYLREEQKESEIL